LEQVMGGAKRRDKYLSFEMLRRAERPDEFLIDCRRRPSTVAIIAPHGGKIEPGTSTIAATIAANDYCLYRFEGRKSRENRDLHITSTHFDEPQCLALISRCDQVVAVHGCEGIEQIVYMGGRDVCLRDTIRGRLDAVGFTTGIHDNPDLQGSHSENICNQGRRRRGVQLEISYGLRSNLTATAPATGAQALATFAAAVRTAIDIVAGRDRAVCGIV
jgi:phage replication-related protein YjqB (UPF0714/DUF867 family)